MYAMYRLQISKLTVALTKYYLWINYFHITPLLRKCILIGPNKELCWRLEVKTGLHSSRSNNIYWLSVLRLCRNSNKLERVDFLFCYWYKHKKPFKLILKTYKGLRNTILLVVTYYNKSNSLQIIVVPSWKPKIVYQLRSGHTNIVNKVVCYFGSRYNTFFVSLVFLL